MFKLDLDLSPWKVNLEEAKEAARAAVRPAAQAGIQILYDDARARVNVKTGNLKKNIYQVYSKTKSNEDYAQYEMSWNHHKAFAPHGQLVEFGHIQYFKTYIGKDGKLYQAVRPEKRGTPRPKSSASLATKSAYYVPLDGGPRQVAAHSFIRAAYDARILEGLRKANQVMLEAVGKALP